MYEAIHQEHLRGRTRTPDALLGAFPAQSLQNGKTDSRKWTWQKQEMAGILGL